MTITKFVQSLIEKFSKDEIISKVEAFYQRANTFLEQFEVNDEQLIMNQDTLLKPLTDELRIYLALVPLLPIDDASRKYHMGLIGMSDFFYGLISCTQAMKDGSKQTYPAVINLNLSKEGDKIKISLKEPKENNPLTEIKECLGLPSSAPTQSYNH